ncbi:MULTISPECIES: TetR/AcrR family transcriptional regulator [unclassified Streptomyces]|uniref:TetR/AcrR family transcriptional regulator n=1 Tax=unclassified Streptomyces TaxID=2593676 RepID=UPI00278C2240|nr:MULTISPECIES: TetR/AcrR family transcriptional regulator [unclassified Streptomyces]
MSENAIPPRVRAGRPTREQAEARHQELLDAALDLFLERGFEVTTIEMIAARVSMTKRTIYARYPDKATLFRAAIQRAVERQIVPQNVLDALDRGELSATLEAIARLRVDQIASPHGLRLQHIINAESHRFPEIFTAYVEQSTRPLIEHVATVLQRAVDAGEIAPTDVDHAASAFMSMVVGGRVRAIVGGLDPTRSELDERVRFAVRLLLDGLRPRPDM